MVGSGAATPHIRLRSIGVWITRLLPAATAEWVVAIVRICSRYRATYGRWPNLVSPRRFSEKMQRRKLFEAEPMFGIFCDKLAVRDYVRDRVGADRLIPLLWSGDDPDLIPLETLTPPYVIKGTHACGHVVMVSDVLALERETVREEVRSWLRQHHALIAVEPGYEGVRPRIVVERTVTTASGERPAERRLFVFDGKVRIIQTTSVWPDGVPRHTAF